MVLPEKSIDKIILKGTKVTCISNILTAKSCPHKVRVDSNRNVDSERHCCFEKWRQSGNISWIIKVKINKNVPESFVTIVTVFSINSRYSNGSILSSVSIVSNVLLQVLLVMCI